MKLILKSLGLSSRFDIAGAPPCLCVSVAPSLAKRLLIPLMAAFLVALNLASPASAAEELYPKHVNPRVQKAVAKGLDYLAKTQGPDGNWPAGPDNAAYPVSMTALAGMAFLANGNTTTRGPYAENVERVVQYLIGQSRPGGIITGATQESGRPMYGHGFALMFLSSAYGMETDPRRRDAMRKVIIAGIDLTSRGQSNAGGWTYIPGGGDEGSVTVTQIQALRAAHNAGFTVPKGVIEASVRYLERCRAPGGGIVYSLSAGGEARLAISCAALATLYNAGEYESKLADETLVYVWDQFKDQIGNWQTAFGHGFYANLYASQAFYQAGDEYWDKYFPRIRDSLLASQAGDGSWMGDGIGNTYGTAIALTILQLPYKFLPIHQR